MTPFAVEISRNIGRFLGNKVRKNDLLSLQNLSQALIGYLRQIYQCADVEIYHNNDSSILLFKHTDNETHTDSYVPCYFIVQDDDDVNNIENLFWRQLHELETMRKTYKNVDSGFVFMVSSRKDLWETSFDYSIVSKQQFSSFSFCPQP